MAESKRLTRTEFVRQVGRRLRLVREEMNMDRAQMAATLGMTENGLGKNETGNNLIGFKTMHALQSKHNISLDWIFFNKGPMKYQAKITEVGFQTENKKIEKQKQELIEKEKEIEEEIETLKKTKSVAMELIELQKIMPDAKELLEHMAKDPELRHKILLDFYSYKKGKEKE